MHRIKEYRIKLGLKQKDLAKILDVDRSTVTKWENNKSHPDFKLIPKIANVFSCDIGDLFLDKEKSLAQDKELSQ